MPRNFIPSVEWSGLQEAIVRYVEVGLVMWLEKVFGVGRKT